MLRAAVQENTDAIEGRLPTALRPGRRLPIALGRHAWLLVLPVSIIVGLALVANRSMAAVQQKPLMRGAAAAATPARLDEPAPASVPDLALLSRRLRPRALALGVRRVVLDPGHGGEHLGTESTNGLVEKRVTLDLALRAERLLIERGFEVVLTRAGDETLSLKERATRANEQRGDIFVSIHLNSLGAASARGIETFYLGPSEQPEHEAMAEIENQNSGYSLADLRTLLDGIYVDARRDESKRLAGTVQDAILHGVRMFDPTMPDRGVKTAPFVVLVATEMPAILAEVSVLSNEGEAERLGRDEYRQRLAEALVSGIEGFVDHNPRSAGERKDTNER